MEIHRPAEAAIAADAQADTTAAISPLAAPQSLRREVRQGMRWSLAAQLVVRVNSLASNIILARLLLPRDFGVYAVAVTTVELLLSFNDLGIIEGLARAQTDVRATVRTATAIAWAAAGLIYVGCFAIAPLIAAALGAPDATAVIRLLAVAVLLDGFCAVPSALLTRALRIRPVGFAAISGSLVSIALSVILAKAGLGVWALAWGRLAGTAVTAALYVALLPWRPCPALDRREAAGLLAFGLPLIGATILQVTLLNLDYIVIGHFLGPVALGYYLLAFNLSSWPVNLISFAARRVTLPGFARLLHDREALARSFATSVGLLVTVTLPAYVLLGVLASSFIRALYGSKWAPAVEVLQYLVVFGAMRVVAYLVGDLLLAIGRPRLALVLQAAWLLPLLPALALGAQLHGIVGVAIAHAVVAVGIAGPSLVLALAHVGMAPRHLWRRLGRPAAGSVAVAAVCLAIAVVVPADVRRVLVAGTASVLVYAAVAVRPALLRDLGLVRRHGNPVPGA